MSPPFLCFNRYLWVVEACISSPCIENYPKLLLQDTFKRKILGLIPFPDSALFVNVCQNIKINLGKVVILSYSRCLESYQ